MRALLATLAVVTCCGQGLAELPRKLVEFRVDRSVVDIDNEFSRSNPYYKQRTGAFYDIKYVAPSAESLIRIADVRAEQMPGTLDALRAFVYEWLDAYVRGNGAIGRSELAKCIAGMDERFDLLFDSPLQRKLYRVWRDDDANQLRFLMVSSADGPDANDKAPPDAAAKPNAECRESLVGYWHSSGGQKGLYLAVASDRRALVVLTRPGSQSFSVAPWKPFHGGILIEGQPRLRLWTGRHDEELRAEFEPAIPEIQYDPDELFFKRFFMKRVNEGTPPSAERAIPDGWVRESLDDEWNMSAGKRTSR